jgi:hypothetical protein
LLCDSHLLPAATFRGLRANGLGNPNPVRFKGDRAYTTSKAVTTYLLCEDCEQRFRRNGEDRVLSRCYLPDGTFPIREALLASVPLTNRNGMVLYTGSAIPEINCDRLIYFAMSVFWRAAAHAWPEGKDRFGIDLGPFREPFRLFLLDQAAFPDNCALAVRVSGLTEFLDRAWFPQSAKKQGFHVHQFSIPGLTFLLATGQRVPRGFIDASTAPSPQRYLAIYTKAEVADLMEAARIAQTASVAKGFR